MVELTGPLRPPARLAPLVAAITAWVSLNPYFFWGSSRPLLAVSVLAGILAAALYASGARPRWRSPEFAGVMLLSVFLVYLTVLPRVEGGHIKWIFVLPSLWLLALLDDQGRRRALADFAAMFAVSLIPGLAVSLLAIIGVPLTFGTIPAANALMAAHGTRMLMLPGTLFVESNSLVLPWGGVLFRLCGMFDEPGMVGTVAGLLLVAHHYRFGHWRTAILYLAGLLSFSLAFAVITTLGLLARVAYPRRIMTLVSLAPVLVAATLSTGIWTIPTPPGTVSAITVVEHTQATPGRAGAPARPKHRLVAGAELRQTGLLDNRSLPSMEALVSDYFGAGPRIWLFGMGSDASVVRGGVSQTWKRLLTDYGAVGFGLLLISIALVAWPRLRASAWAAVFVGLFVLSIYQRPIVWMPYTLLILLCGSVFAAASPVSATDSGSRSRRIRMAAPAALLLLLTGGVTAAVLWTFWPGQRAPVNPLPVTRLPPPFTAAPQPVEAAVQRAEWTEYGDYGTVRIGRIERPAHLLTGRRRWVRQVAVPAGGARYEVFVGAIDAPATVRMGRNGTMLSDVKAAVGEWTSVALDLDSSAAAEESLSIELDVEPGGVAAWGRELVVANQPGTVLPDILLISLDTVRRDQLTPYAPALPTTPALAALAREAMVFDDAVSTSSWTVSSHATLFTGYFPPDSLGYHSRVEPEEHTLPEILAASGYRTFGVSGGPYTDPRWGMHQGFDEYVASGARENARDATSRALDWMSQAGGAPVFLFLNYFDAHEPLELSDEVKRATGVTADVPGTLWFELEAGHRPVTAAMRARLLAAYRAELTAIDDQLRRLIDHLKRSGRWDRTLVIVWSDHGQLLGERGYLGHAYTLEEELLRVPLIIKAPSGTSPGPGRHRGLIQGDDLFGLTQALAGLPSADGSGMLSALRRNAPVRRLAFSKIHHEPLPELVVQRRWRSATQWAVHDGNTKIVRTLEGETTAYDVTGQEERTVAMPGPSSPLLTALDRFRSWPGHTRSGRTVGPLSPAERERLRSLGYIQ